MTSDNELSRAGLARNLSAFHPDNNDSVSEGLQSGCEVIDSWCKNILADHPSGPALSDHGKEPSGHVVRIGVDLPCSAVSWAGIAPVNNVNCGDVGTEHAPDVVEDRDAGPMPAEKLTCWLPVVAAPERAEAGPLEAKAHPAATAKE